MKGIAIFLLLMLTALTATSVSADNSIQYPDRAWKLNQSGEVTVVYDIDKSGKPENVRIQESEPKYLFDDSVKAQIYSWKFPEGHPQKDIRLHISFKRK